MANKEAHACEKGRVTTFLVTTGDAPTNLDQTNKQTGNKLSGFCPLPRHVLPFFTIFHHVLPLFYHYFYP